MNIVQFQKLAQVLAGYEKAAKEPNSANTLQNELQAILKSDPLRAAFPDYGKSLVSQSKRNPHVAGIARGAASGAGVSVLAALIARLLTDNPAAVGGAAAGGALLGAVPGYISGAREAQSEHTKNLALRRLGINNPAEALIMRKAPHLTSKLTQPGVYL